MNRERKFRAKHTDDNDWESFTITEITAFHIDGDIIFCNGKACSISSLTQYTGLKDKNGKEIYEDLIKE